MSYTANCQTHRSMIKQLISGTLKNNKTRFSTSSLCAVGVKKKRDLPYKGIKGTTPKLFPGKTDDFKNERRAQRFEKHRRYNRSLYSQPQSEIENARIRFAKVNLEEDLDDDIVSTDSGRDVFKQPQKETNENGAENINFDDILDELDQGVERISRQSFSSKPSFPSTRKLQELLTPRPEYPKLEGFKGHIPTRVADGWVDRATYNRVFKETFSKHPTFQRIWNNNLGRLDTSKLVSPVDFAKSDPQQMNQVMTVHKQKYGDNFEVENDFVTVNEEIFDSVFTGDFKKGEVVMIASSPSKMGDKAIVVGPVKDERYERAIEFGGSDMTHARNGYIVVKIRHPMIDPMYRYDQSIKTKERPHAKMKSFGAKVEIEAPQFLAKTGHIVDFKFLDDPKLFNYFIDPFERPFIEEQIIVPELEKRFNENRDMFLWVGVGRSSAVKAEHIVL